MDPGLDERLAYVGCKGSEVEICVLSSKVLGHEQGVTKGWILKIALTRSWSQIQRIRSPSGLSSSCRFIIERVILIPTVPAEIVLVPEGGGEKGEPSACGIIRHQVPFHGGLMLALGPTRKVVTRYPQSPVVLSEKMRLHASHSA